MPTAYAEEKSGFVRYILYMKKYRLGFPEKPAVSFSEELVSFRAHFLSLSDSGSRQILGPQPHVDTKTAG